MPRVTRAINAENKQCESLFGQNIDVCVLCNYSMSSLTAFVNVFVCGRERENEREKKTEGETSCVS